MKNTIIKVLSVVMAMVFAFGSCLVAVSATDAACDHANATVYGQVEATCEYWGYTLYECPDCDTYFTKDNVNELIPPHCLSDGFAWEDVDTVPATCVAKGYETKTCPVCDTVITNEISEINPDGHVWGEWTVTEKQTCTGEGVKARTCTLCEKVETEAVDADGHEWIADEDDVVAPTCQEEGSMPYHCANCDATREVVIKVCGHKYIQMGAVKNTCGVQGHTAGRYCEWCLTPDPTDSNAKLDQKIDHKVDDNHPDTVIVKATCTTAGSKTGVCKNCGKENIVEVLPALGHDWERENAKATISVEAGCLTWGFDLFGCGCGELFINQTDAPLGHNHVATGVILPATCTTPGGKEMVCDREWITWDYDNATYKKVKCVDVNDKDEHTKIEEDPAQPALGHDPIDVAPVEPTCTTGGNTEGVKCSRCDYTTVKNLEKLGHIERTYVCTTNAKKDIVCIREGCPTPLLEENLDATIPAGAPVTHVWENKTNLTPDCLVDQYDVLACKYCNQPGKQLVAAAGHTEETNEKAATCVSTGYKIVTCTVCSKTLENTVYAIDPNGHVDVDVLGVTSPDCENAGKEVGTCSNCKKPYEKVLPATGHDYQTVDGYAADCLNPGLTDGSQCSVCQKWETKQIVILALGHNMVSEAGKLPTCEEAGYTPTKYCDREGCTYVEIPKVDLNALNHGGYAIKGGKDATCANGGSYGYKSHFCEYCDDAYIDNFVYAPEHSWGADIVEPVTCTTDGYTTAQCSVCFEFREKTDIVEAKGHLDDEGNVIPTACNRGEIEDIHCVVCDQDIEPQCDWIFTDYIPATCQTYRHNIYVCGICGEEKMEIVYGLGGHVTTTTRNPAAPAVATFDKAITITESCTLCDWENVTYETAGVQFTTKIVNGKGADKFVNGSTELKVEIYMKGDHTKFNTVFMQFKFTSSAIEYKNAKENSEIIHGQEFEKYVNGDVITMSFCESNDGGQLGSLELTNEEVLFATLTFKIKDTYLGLGHTGAKDLYVGNIEESTLLAINADNNAIYSELGDVTTNQNVYLRGDLTNDGKINSHDLVAMRALIANNSGTAIGDISLDGNVNQADFILLRNWVLGAKTYPTTN